MARTLNDRIQERLGDLGKSERAASLEAGLSDAFVRNIRLGKSTSPRTDTIDKLAAVLNTTTAWLLREEGPKEISGTATPAPNASFPPRYQRFPTEHGVPLLGQTVTGPNGRFVLNGQKIGEVFMPPDLAGVEGAYAVQVYGTSMEPAFRAGQTVWLNPHKPARAGDYVVAQILTDEEHSFESYLKEFVSQSSTQLKLKQLNPEEGEGDILTFPAEKVFSVHKVVFAAFV